MQARILCVVTADRITRPSAKHYENNRIYEYPEPGSITHCRSEGIVVHMLKSSAPEGSPLRETFRWEPGTNVDVGYGCMVFEDLQTKQEKAQVIPIEDSQREFEVVTWPGEERAKDLAHQWHQYGCVLMSGEVPTVEEMEKAKEYRRNYGLNRLNDVIDLQNKRRGGMKGIKPNFDRADRSWAKEFGVALVDTVELLPRHPGARQDQAATQTLSDIARVQCPECGERIAVVAKICPHCRTKFKMSVEEFLTQPAEQEVTT